MNKFHQIFWLYIWWWCCCCCFWFLYQWDCVAPRAQRWFDSKWISLKIIFKSHSLLMPLAVTVSVAVPVKTASMKEGILFQKQKPKPIRLYYYYFWLQVHFEVSEKMQGHTKIIPFLHSFQEREKKRESNSEVYRWKKSTNLKTTYDVHLT